MPAQFVAVDSAGAASSNADQFTHNKKKALNRQEFMQCIVCPRPIEFSPSSRIRILIRILIRMLIRIAAGRPEALPISPAAPIPPHALYTAHTHTHTHAHVHVTQHVLRTACPSVPRCDRSAPPSRASCSQDSSPTSRMPSTASSFRTSSQEPTRSSSRTQTPGGRTSTRRRWTRCYAGTS